MKLSIGSIVIFILTFMLLTSPLALASDTYSYEHEAVVLHELGLYKGISETEFIPDLGTTLNRETGVVMLLRLFGLANQADAVQDPDSILGRFDDADKIAGWAKNSVAYAVEHGLVQGMTSATFGPKLALNGRMYCTLILRQMGFDPDYNNAPVELAEVGGLRLSEAEELLTKELIKDDLVGISYGALKSIKADGISVIQYLVEAEIISAEKAVETGLLGDFPHYPEEILSPHPSRDIPLPEPGQLEEAVPVPDTDSSILLG